jgi:hypothetical protein
MRVERPEERSTCSVLPSILVVQQLAWALGTTMSELLAEVEREQGTGWPDKRPAEEVRAASLS